MIPFSAFAPPRSDRPRRAHALVSVGGALLCTALLVVVATPAVPLA